MKVYSLAVPARAALARIDGIYWRSPGHRTAAKGIIRALNLADEPMSFGQIVDLNRWSERIACYSFARDCLAQMVREKMVAAREDEEANAIVDAATMGRAEAAENWRMPARQTDALTAAAILTRQIAL